MKNAIRRNIIRCARPSGKVSVEDLRRVSQAAGVRAVRAIQCVTFYGYDNRYLCDSASRIGSGCGVYAHSIPMIRTVPGCFSSSRESTEFQPCAASLRPPANRLTTRGCASCGGWLRRKGLTIDIFLMRLEMVPSATRILRDYPALDRGLRPLHGSEAWTWLAPCLDAVLKLSRFPNLHPKLDFIGTGTEQKFPCEDLHEPCLKIIDAYGPERCVWGS